MGFFSSNKPKQEPAESPSAPQPEKYTPATPITSTEQNYKSTSSTSMSKQTIISEGTLFEGNIKTESAITIDGQFKGTIASKNKVIVGPNGKIEGDITCVECEIYGKQVGNVTVQDMLYLKGTAFIQGEITTGKLVMENGVQFNGKCNMGARLVPKENPAPTTSASSSTSATPSTSAIPSNPSPTSSNISSTPRPAGS
jgi:cytoskeletal protein CcmA (bactofilin family)